MINALDEVQEAVDRPGGRKAPAGRPVVRDFVLLEPFPRDEKSIRKFARSYRPAP